MKRRKLNNFITVAFIPVLVLAMSFLASGQGEGTPGVGERKIVTLDVKSMDIVDVLKIVSDTSGWTIICSPGVKGRVTLWIKDITVQELLDEVLAINGYVYTRKGNSLTVMTQDEYARMYGKERKVFTIRYANVNDMAKYLKSISSREGKIIADPRTRKIAVIDTKETLKRMEELIAGLDDETITRTFKLKFADPDQVKTKLEKMVSRQGKLESDKRTGEVIVTDIPANIEAMKGIVQELDQACVTRIFTLRYAKGDEVKAGLEKFLSPGGNIQVDKRTNKLVITDTSQNLERIQETLVQLDKKLQTEVIQIKYAKVEDIKTKVEKFLSSGGSLQADKRTDQLVITDSPPNIERIRDVVAQLDREPQTYVYQLNYADPEKIKEKLTKLLPEPEGIIQVDKKTDTVTIIAIPGKIAQIEKLLPLWDKKTKQVLIEARIMLVSVNKLEKIGIDWTRLDSHAFKAAATFPPDIATGGVSGLLEIGSLDKDEYHAVIQALETDADTDLLSNPKILVLDGEEAEFSVGSDQPYKVIILQNNTRIEDVRFARVGVTLSVTPQINEAGFITMKVHPEVSSLSEIRDGIPVVEKREAQSTVMVEDGKTIVIGGLIQTEDIKTVNSVPILGRIPILGFFFRNTKTEKTKKDLVIFLTPLITP